MNRDLIRSDGGLKPSCRSKLFAIKVVVPFIIYDNKIYGTAPEGLDQDKLIDAVYEFTATHLLDVAWNFPFLGDKSWTLLTKILSIVNCKIIPEDYKEMLLYIQESEGKVMIYLRVPKGCENHRKLFNIVEEEIKL